MTLRAGNDNLSKMDAAKQACTHVLQQIPNGLAVTVMTFNSTADTLIPSTVMSDDARLSMNQVIGTLRPENSTNFYKMLSLLARHVQHRSTFVLVLTDGEATEGPIKSALTVATDSVLDPLPKFVFNVVALGADPDMTYLLSMVKSRGRVLHAMCSSDLTDTLVTCVGGLFTVATETAVSAHISTGDATISRLCPTALGNEIVIGPILQRQTVVASAQLAVTPGTDPITITVRLSAVDAKSGQFVSEDGEVVITRNDNDGMSSPNADADVHDQRIKAADALQKAAQMADGGDLPAAAAVLAAALSVCWCSVSYSSSHPITMFTYETLRKQHENFSSRQAFAAAGGSLEARSRADCGLRMASCGKVRSACC